MPFQDVWPCQESTNKRLNTRGAGSVISIERTLRGQGAPSSEEFVTAVIRVHERLIARLKALAGSPSPADREAHEDAEIIRSYSALNGVTVGVADGERGRTDPERQGRYAAFQGATSNPGHRS